jgi:hypothetical protein
MGRCVPRQVAELPANPSSTERGFSDEAQHRPESDLLHIDDIMAMTHRTEFTVCTVAPEPARVGYQGSKQCVGTVKQRGKRKEFYLDLADDDILLDGWDLPFKTDLEAGGVCSGNACFNLVGDPAAIKACIEGKAVFPVSDSAKAKIIVATGPRTVCDGSGQQLLYPDIETHHAVVNRFKAAEQDRRDRLEQVRHVATGSPEGTYYGTGNQD